MPKSKWEKKKVQHISWYINVGEGKEDKTAFVKKKKKIHQRLDEERKSQPNETSSVKDSMIDVMNKVRKKWNIHRMSRESYTKSRAKERKMNSRRRVEEVHEEEQ